MNEMNIQIWNNELSIFEDEDADMKEDIVTIWKSGTGLICMKLNEKYRMTDEDGGYGNIIQVISKSPESHDRKR